MADGYDGRELIENLKKHLAAGSKVLELGMGPGKDLDVLKETYTATGSDNSNVFLELYREQHPDADILLLDAVEMNTSRSFDCIYSNKVLHHLTKQELTQSIMRQCKMLKNGGLLFHSFWHGDKEESYEGLRFVYYTELTLQETLGNSVDKVKVERYREMEDEDSFYVILKPAKPSHRI